MTQVDLRVILQGDEPILACLSPARMGAVVALAAAPAGAARIPPRPGHVFARDLDEEHVGITGTPLGGADDPRHAYLALHRRLAREITGAAVHSPARQAEKPRRRGFLGWLLGPHWAPAPVFAIVVALLLGQGLWLDTPPDAKLHERGMKAPSSCANTPRVRITFKADVSQQAVVLLLRKTDARVVDGPSETGEWWLSLPADIALDEGLAQLRNSPLVADVMTIDEKTFACKP